MSGGHFAGILTLLTCRGSKGRSPLASLGTAQRLAPVQSGLPLAKLACHLPTTEPIPSKQLYPTVLSTLHVDDSGFVMQGQTGEEMEKLPFR